MTTCISCRRILVEGDAVFPDYSGGFIHEACCGNPENFVDSEGEPLAEGDKPVGVIWKENYP